MICASSMVFQTNTINRGRLWRLDVYEMLTICDEIDDTQFLEPWEFGFGLGEPDEEIAQSLL